MDLSMKWINDYVDLKNIDIKQFCHEMTMSGSKVEGYETEGSEISNVVIGKLLSVVPHENSDHLVVCQVEVGKTLRFRSLQALRMLKQAILFRLLWTVLPFRAESK